MVAAGDAGQSRGATMFFVVMAATLNGVVCAINPGNVRHTGAPAAER